LLEPVKEGSIVIFDYKNWQGVHSTRRVLVKGFFYGFTTYHPHEDQLFLSGFDLDKSVNRDFSVSDITNLAVISQEEN
jgi:hypothetical protein